MLFWIICLLVVVAVAAGLSRLMRSRGGNGDGSLAGTNHDALQDGAAQANGRHIGGV